MEIKTKNDIINLLKSNDSALFKYADEIRKKTVGNEVHLRGLIEFSNICKRNCAYCGLQAKNKFIERYRLSPEEIIKIAQNGVNSGYKTIVLQSGEDEFYTEKILCGMIEKIKRHDVIITLSIGERKYSEYKAFKEAGADRFLLRIETTDEKLYSKLHPNMSFKNRVECLYNLKELGYETGTGSLVGLPEQTIESLADDILFYKKLDADMIGIGPFIPHENTPLKGELNPKNFDLALRMMAITRILLPDINIPATTAMETINKEGRIIALNSGANVIMPNITTEKYSKNYEIYPNKSKLDNLDEVASMLSKINRTISSSKGCRKNPLN